MVFPRTPLFRAAPALAAALVLVLAGCAPTHENGLRPRTYAWPVPLETTFDLARGRPANPERWEARLANTRLLFLGEHHTDPRSHEFQLEVLRLLLARGRKVTVALEMLPPSANEALEGWRTRRLDEAAFLDAADWYGYWRFPWAHYRELFTLARRHGVPLKGINAEPATRDAVRKGDVSGLPEKVRAELGELEDHADPHSLFLLDILGATGHGEGLKGDADPFRAYRRVQWMWDRLMGLRAARLAEGAGPGNIVVVLLGSGHLAYGLGANLQAARVTLLPTLSVWDEVLENPPEGGTYPVPVGMADLARVYPPLETEAAFPRLRGVRLEKAGQPPGVRVAGAHGKPPPGQPELKEGDRILAVGGEPVTTPAGVTLAVEGLAFGESVTLEVERDGQRLSLAFRPEAGQGRGH